MKSKKKSPTKAERETNECEDRGWEGEGEGFIRIATKAVTSTESGLKKVQQQAFLPSPGKAGSEMHGNHEAEKRIPWAWNETHEISFWQEPECD